MPTLIAANRNEYITTSFLHIKNNGDKVPAS